MSYLWRVVTLGPGQSGRERRVVSAGPWHPKRETAAGWAQFLANTGMFERVLIEPSGRRALKLPPSDVYERIS